MPTYEEHQILHCITMSHDILDDYHSILNVAFIYSEFTFVLIKLFIGPCTVCFKIFYIICIPVP
jgi:hypothetical protein